MAATKKTTKAKKTPARATKTTKKSAKKAAKPAPTPAIDIGAIAHTEFASADPGATRTWAKSTFGWTFAPPMKMPDGDYHMWNGGATMESGGIRNTMGPENPGTIVYVAVADVKRAYEKALKNGAKEMLPPTAIGGDMGSMAVVSAPGGVAVGLWSMK